MLRHALNCVQHLRLQPAMSALTSRAVAVQMLLQERKSSLQTRMLWLPVLHGEGVGCSDCTGGVGLVGMTGVCACAAAMPSKNMRPRSAALIILVPPSAPSGAAINVSLEPRPVKRNLSGLVHHQMVKKPSEASAISRREAPLRFRRAAWLLLVSLALAQGCATNDAATRAAEQAAMESDDDTLCQKKGAPDSKAYEACRKERAEARAQAAAVQEQKRRDFDRTLGQGTYGQSGF
jgi:hypothetical protein